MNIQQLRSKYRQYRNQLTQVERSNWNDIEVCLKNLNHPPQPHEWVSVIQEYLGECLLNRELDYWEENRCRNPQGWGENIDHEKDIKGWDENLNSWEKLKLVKRQIHEDLQVEISYGQWLGDRD